jgi:hypothetical protein
MPLTYKLYVWQFTHPEKLFFFMEQIPRTHLTRSHRVDTGSQNVVVCGSTQSH